MQNPFGEAERAIAERPDLGLVVLDMLLGDAHAGDLARVIKLRQMPLMVASSLGSAMEASVSTLTITKLYLEADLPSATGQAFAGDRPPAYL